MAVLHRFYCICNAYDFGLIDSELALTAFQRGQWHIADSPLKRLCDESGKCSIFYKSLIAVLIDNEVNYHKSMCLFISISKTSWAERDSAHTCHGHVLTKEQYEVSEHL